jgi:ATP-binding cassette, subfamily B, multidrug efflux pump
MTKLAKYLKPYTLMIILTIALLFIQAMCNLALPDYMSNIVNKGIQQGGIVSAVPEALRQSKMVKLVLFMNEEDKNYVLASYNLIDKGSIDFEKYLKDYPVLEKEPVYVLNDKDETNIETLNTIMGKAFLAVGGIEKMVAEAENGVISFNGRNIPADTDVFDLLTKLPAEQRMQMFDAMNKQFGVLDDSMIIQASAAPIKAEYTELGINTDKIQNRYIINAGIIMLLISLLAGACAITVGFLSAKTAAGAARDLRRSTFVRIENFSGIEFDKFSTASLITRTTNDITQIQMLIVIMMRMVFFAPIMGIGGIIRAVGKSASMSWIIALAVLILLCLILVVFSVAMPKFKLMQKFIIHNMLSLLEHLFL